VPRWKKGQTDFLISANRNKRRGYQTTIPKPVAELLGLVADKTKVKFVIKGKRIEIQRGVE
jgi:hypothetical protein